MPTDEHIETMTKGLRQIAQHTALSADERQRVSDAASMIEGLDRKRAAAQRANEHRGEALVAERQRVDSLRAVIEALGSKLA